MTEEEVKEVEKQQVLRKKLEEQCKAKNWTLHDVFVSDIEAYRDPNNHEFTWTSLDKRKKSKKYTERYRPKLRVEVVK